MAWDIAEDAAIREKVLESIMVLLKSEWVVIGAQGLAHTDVRSLIVPCSKDFVICTEGIGKHLQLR